MTWHWPTAACHRLMVTADLLSFHFCFLFAPFDAGTLCCMLWSFLFISFYLPMPDARLSLYVGGLGLEDGDTNTAVRYQRDRYAKHHRWCRQSNFANFIRSLCVAVNCPRSFAMYRLRKVFALICHSLYMVRFRSVTFRKLYPPSITWDTGAGA